MGTQHGCPLPGDRGVVGSEQAGGGQSVHTGTTRGFSASRV